MKTIIKLLTALLAIMILSTTALAQQGGRRNGTISARQETKAEKKQEKVDKAQYPTNVTNQPVTDMKLRQTPDTQSDRRNGTDNRNSGSVGGNSGSNHGNGANHGNSGNGSVGGNTNRPPAGNNGAHNGNTNNRPPAGNGNAGMHNGNHGNTPPPVNHGGIHNGNRPSGYIPGYADMYPGKRPPIPTVRNYDRIQVYERNNAAGIVVNTLFTTKMEAYDYIARLLNERYYTLDSYGNNYNWIRSEVSFIPTPFDWTNPMTHNQFQMYFKITKSLGRVKVTITAQWRESVLSDRFTALRYQPSNAYSTYYAWNVLEDIADNIPNTGIYFRTADLL